MIARASAYADPELRSLDSIHLATAEYLLAAAGEPLHAFVAYDERLLGAARDRGLAVAAPGAI